MANRSYEAEFEPRPAEQARENEVKHQRFLDRLVRAGLGNAEAAERAAVVVLAALEHRISPGEARDLNLELPWKLRDLVRAERGAAQHPRSRPERFGRDELLARVAGSLDLEEADVERVVRTVLQHVRGLVSEKASSDVIGQLPPELQALWAPPA
jgi:uncharacterized protein (DUF2267 family)